MTTPAEAPPNFRRAVLLMTATSFLGPAGGVITAPILARALDADGRGQLAAALAPAGLTLAAATLGLPDALTFFLAKRPGLARRSLRWASLITFVLGLVCCLIVVVCLPFLRSGDHRLGQLILLATLLTVPALVVGVFRGAATGLQMWRAVALERLIATIARVASFVVLFVLGDLTVLTAVLVNVVIPMVSGLVYLPLLRLRGDRLTERRPVLVPVGAEEEARAEDGDDDYVAVIGDGGMRFLVSFGSKLWFGSVASMMLDRLAPVLMAPLSDTRNLGLYTVANTISDMPLIVALAIAGTLYGVNSKATDASQITGTSRMTLLAGIAGCTVLGGTLPWWIGPLFGDEFKDATAPTLLLMASTLVVIPGLMAVSGLGAFGRPGLRSVGLGLTLVATLTSFVILVPPFGDIGACAASMVGSITLSGSMIFAARRVMEVRACDFWLLRLSDIRQSWRELLRMVRFVSGWI